MGDTNPVHNDAELVEKLGLRGPVAQGPASLAYVINMLMDWQPDGMLERFSFRFEDVVTVGDEPTARGVVTAVDGGGAVVDVSLGLQTGATAVRGTATMRFQEAK
jgi:acyl dehydratase